MPHSHHSHSGQFCKHAKGTLEEVVLEAIRKNFQVYGLTEHVPRYRPEDLYPEEEGIPLDELASQFERFLDEAHRLKTRYASQITLLVGLETEYITGPDLDYLDALLTRVGPRVEYIVGSIHHVNATPIDFDLATYHKALNSLNTSTSNATQDTVSAEQQETFLSAYFDAQYELLQRFHPEVVGHFDLCRLYEPGLLLAEYPTAWAKAERNVKFAVDYGALFEVNAAAFRKGWDTAYPGRDVVALILKHGGRFALSDDSHGPHAVGLNYDRLPEYLTGVGITELWTLQRSDAAKSTGRRTQPVRLQGDWQNHPFWN
ncbi:hypothetical protein H0H92_015873 [Tricholoma furcatifolium]|nr:hypothetical protein H0H92_015873 [Tricholoma furcatifolium]